MNYLKDKGFNLFQDIANPVLFSALKTSGVHHAGSYINSFTKFLSNHGNVFDLATGIFRAPRSGVFEFSASMVYDESGLTIPLTFTIHVEKNNIRELVISAYKHQ